MSDELTSKFDRQRRNLVLTWAVLFFVQTVGVELDALRVSMPSIQFAFQASHPERLILWICGLLIYFIWRYYIYFNKTHAGKLRADAREMALHFAAQHAREVGLLIAQRDFPDHKVNNVTLEATNQQGSSFEFVVERVHWEDGGNTGHFRRTLITVGGFTLWIIWQRAYIHAALQYPSFSEYLLPLMLPWISIVYGLFF